MWFEKENLSKVSVKTFGQNVRLEKGLGFRASSLPTQFFKMWVQKENFRSKRFGQNVSVKTFGQNVSVKTFGQNVS